MQTLILAIEIRHRIPCYGDSIRRTYRNLLVYRWCEYERKPPTLPEIHAYHHPSKYCHHVCGLARSSYGSLLTKLSARITGWAPLACVRYLPLIHPHLLLNVSRLRQVAALPQTLIFFGLHCTVASGEYPPSPSFDLRSDRYASQLL